MVRRSAIENARALYAIASSQGGYFTSAQARAAGYAYAQQFAKVQRGVWDRLEWGLFRLRDFPRVPHEDFIRWTLWSRDRRGVTHAVVSHESALLLHDLSDVMPSVAHLTVPPGFRKPAPPGCRLHRARLGPGEIEERSGFRVTTPLRTLLDVATGPLSQDYLNDAVADAIRTDLVRRDVLEEARIPEDAHQRILLALESTSAEPRVRG